MSSKELSDNLAFLSAQQLLNSLVENNVLTEKEAEQVRKELIRRLRPTI
jgi:hypothetical protein